MAEAPMSVRRFHIRRCEHPLHGCIVEEQTMHEAAVAWLERHPELATCASEIRIVARDEETGEETRFHFFLDTGGTPT
jgi:hypothetical protein